MCRKAYWGFIVMVCPWIGSVAADPGVLTKTKNTNKNVENKASLMKNKGIISKSSKAAPSATDAKNVEATPDPIRSKISGVKVSIYGKIRADTSFGNNKTKYCVLFEPPSGDIIDLSALFTNGSKIWTHRANVWQNVNSSEFGIKASREVGLGTVSFVLGLTGNANSSQSVKESYAEFATPWATVVLGNVKGNENRSACGPQNFACGSGGTDGNFFPNFCNPTTLVFMAPSMVGYTGVASKGSVYLARVGGLQLSLSYTPNTGSLGEERMNTARQGKKALVDTFDQNSFCPALTYAYSSGLFSLNLSAIYLTGQTKPELPNQGLLQRFNTKSLETGCTMAYGPWNVGFEFIYNGRGGCLKHAFAVQPKLSEVNGENTVVLTPKVYYPHLAGGYYTMNSGIAYLGKGWGASFTCLYTSRRTGFLAEGQKKTAKATGLGMVLSLEYEVCNGVMPYVEFANYRMKNPDWAYVGTAAAALTKFPFTAVPNNSASGVLTGFKIQF
jgi:hypothetical protein